MRFADRQLLMVGLLVSGCAGQSRPVSTPSNANLAATAISGVWDGQVKETLTAGMGAGDTRVEKQEWHLDQSGTKISGYYLAALTFTSGDGRPYVCSRQASFSALVRFDVSGQVQANDGSIELDEVTQNPSQGRCTPSQRPLAHYRAVVRGDVLTLLKKGPWEGPLNPPRDGAAEPSPSAPTRLLTDGSAQEQRQTLYRNRGKPQAPELLAAAAEAAQVAQADEALSSPNVPKGSVEGVGGSSPADVSGVWIWEHRGEIPTGDEKQEREEWHVDQDGPRLSGYYDRVVREISTDGHAFKCSMDTEFEIATRYKFRGEVRGNQLVIYESSYEVLEPSACDNGQRRLDAYEGMANGDEVRLIWGVGGQVLRRPRPDVPTQRF